MSRIGKTTHSVPDKVNGRPSTVRHVTVKGPKGELHHAVHPNITVKQEDGSAVVDPPERRARTPRAARPDARAAGATWSRASPTGFERDLTIEGVGYTSDLRGKTWLCSWAIRTKSS